MSKKKAAVVLASTVLIASLVIGGTLAYLTDTGAVTNTFTMGNVDIDLAEPNWEDETSGKELVPGDTLVKDPIVAAVEGNSYMRVKMEIIDTATGLAIADTDRISLILSTIYTDTTYDAATAAPGTNIVAGTKYAAADVAAFAGVNTADFAFDVTRTADPAVRYYNYGGIFTTGTSPKTALFTNIVIPSDFTKTETSLLGSYSVVLTAQAIQSDNFASSAEAFTALDAA